MDEPEKRSKPESADAQGPHEAQDAPATPPDAIRPEPRLDEARHVAVFFDLQTRDGRRAVEVRAVTSIANGFYASPRATLYSCAYATQAERILALRRARLFCETRGQKVVHFGRTEERRAAWQ